VRLDLVLRLRLEIAGVMSFVQLFRRPADIGQTLILGAHGPRRLHVIVVG
jgi:LUD domain